MLLCYGHRPLEQSSWTARLASSTPLDAACIISLCDSLPHTHRQTDTTQIYNYTSTHFMDVIYGCYYYYYTRLTALCQGPGLPGWSGTRKVKPIWILLKQETASDNGISWAICKSAPRSRQITTSAPHHSVFYRPDALPAAQPTASKHWRHIAYTANGLYLHQSVYAHFLSTGSTVIQATMQADVWHQSKIGVSHQGFLSSPQRLADFIEI